MGSSLSSIPRFFYNMKRGALVYTVLAFLLSVAFGVVSDFPIESKLGPGRANEYLYFILLNVIGFFYINLAFFLLFKGINNIFKLSLNTGYIYIMATTMTTFHAIFSLAFMNVGIFSLVFSTALMTAVFLALNFRWIGRSSYSSVAGVFISAYLFIEAFAVLIFFALT